MNFKHKNYVYKLFNCCWKFKAGFFFFLISVQVPIRQRSSGLQDILSNWDCLKPGKFWERIWICINTKLFLPKNWSHWTTVRAMNLKMKTIFVRKSFSPMRLTFIWVSKQNCQFWCKESQQIIHEKALNSLKSTFDIRCDVWSGKIIENFERHYHQRRVVWVNDNQMFMANIKRTWYWQHLVPTRRFGSTRLSRTYISLDCKPTIIHLLLIYHILYGPQLSL